MKQTNLTILENTRLADGIYRLRLAGDTSAITAPGQFVNLKLSGFFLRRPISVCDWENGEVTLIYKVLGHGTEAMTGMAVGTALDVLTGLGNGFDLSRSGEHPLLAGGGVHYVLAKENDTFENIGRKFRLSARNLRKFNDLKDKKAQPVPGETVYIERKRKRWEGNSRHHICRQGETAYSVGQSYAIRTRSIEKLNHLRKDEELAAGREIRIK